MGTTKDHQKKHKKQSSRSDSDTVDGATSFAQLSVLEARVFRI